MDPATLTAYIDYAFLHMRTAADAAGDRLNDRPFGEETNSIGALVVHCCGVCEFWLGHVALGRPTSRDRDAEFSATPTMDELRALIAATRAQVAADLTALAAGEGKPSPIREHLLTGGDDESLTIHLVEELFQHVGHMQLTVDVFRNS
jgi:hypothetical protein